MLGRRVSTFDLISQEQCDSITTVTIDMSAAYEKAITERLPNATIVFDRFHVQQLSSDAVDEVRRGQHRELRDAGDTEEAKVIKGTRFALLKNPWNLTRDEGKKLRDSLSSRTRGISPVTRASSSAMSRTTTHGSFGRTY